MARVIDTLAKPLPPAQAALFIGAACVAVGIYCLAYNALAGGHVTLGEAFGWSLSMIAPWLVAFEVQKRLQATAAIVATLMLTMLASLATGVLLMDQPLSGFSVIRRLPAFGLTAALIFALEVRQPRRQQAPTALPLRGEDIQWVRAAGNYVELNGPKGTITHRATLAATQAALSDEGFVRIHRSMLVRRDAIERVRTEDVVLKDGTHLRLGKRFRAALAA